MGSRKKRLEGPIKTLQEWAEEDLYHGNDQYTRFINWCKSEQIDIGSKSTRAKYSGLKKKSEL